MHRGSYLINLVCSTSGGNITSNIFNFDVKTDCFDNKAYNSTSPGYESEYLITKFY